MGVKFEMEDGQSFIMEGHPNTVNMIKDKVYLYTRIPIRYQTLIFKDNVLDDGSVESYSIIRNSCIQLQIFKPDRFRGGPNTARSAGSHPP